MEIKKNYFQWDVNQYIPIKDKYCDFVIKGEVYRLEATDGNVKIPDECFLTPGRKFAYICCEDGTRSAFAFNVTARPMPPGFVYTETRKITFDDLADEVKALAEDLQHKVASGYFANQNYCSRVKTLDNTNFGINNIIDTVGAPKYVADDELANYTQYGLTETGWYVFAKIFAKQGETVANGFSIAGVAGYVNPAIGQNHVVVAIKFGVIAESQEVIINWGQGQSTEGFVFKSTDLAVRNLDYRVTFYLYAVDDYCTWEYQLATDSTFVANKNYYKLLNGEYVKSDVEAGASIPANTYYEHKSLTIQGYTRNVSYTLDTIVDCPITIYLPEVADDNYGAWFEVQMNFLKSFSVTIIPAEGQKVSANGVHTPKEGINIINVLYHKPTNTWLPTVTNWKVAA